MTILEKIADKLFPIGVDDFCTSREIAEIIHKKIRRHLRLSFRWRRDRYCARWAFCVVRRPDMKLFVDRMNELRDDIDEVEIIYETMLLGHIIRGTSHKNYRGERPSR